MPPCAAAAIQQRKGASICDVHKMFVFYTHPFYQQCLSRKLGYFLASFPHLCYLHIWMPPDKNEICHSSNTLARLKRDRGEGRAFLRAVRPFISRRLWISGEVGRCYTKFGGKSTYLQCPTLMKFLDLVALNERILISEHTIHAT